MTPWNRRASSRCCMPQLESMDFCDLLCLLPSAVAFTRGVPIPFGSMTCFRIPSRNFLFPIEAAGIFKNFNSNIFFPHPFKKLSAPSCTTCAGKSKSCSWGVQKSSIVRAMWLHSHIFVNQRDYVHAIKAKNTLCSHEKLGYFYHQYSISANRHCIIAEIAAYSSVVLVLK